MVFTVFIASVVILMPCFAQDPCGFAGLWRNNDTMAPITFRCSDDIPASSVGSITGELPGDGKTYAILGRFQKLNEDYFLGFSINYLDSVGLITGFYSAKDNTIKGYSQTTKMSESKNFKGSTTNYSDTKNVSFAMFTEKRNGYYVFPKCVRDSHRSLGELRIQTNKSEICLLSNDEKN